VRSSDGPDAPDAGDDESVADTLTYRSDGGTASPFRTTAEVDETRWDRYQRLYETYLGTPISIVRKDYRAIVGLSILGLYLLFGFVAAFLMEPTELYEAEPFIQPFQTMEYPLGTDKFGQDITYQAFYSIVPLGKMMLSGAMLTIGLGTTVGIISGYKGGMIDRILSTVADVFINLPGLPLVIVLSVLFQPKSELLIGLLLAVASWAGLARAIRSQVLTLRQESFVEAARAMDVPSHRLMYREILPHLLPYIAVNTAQAAQTIIFAAVGLYFLGILPFTGANWGIMLSQAYAASAFFSPTRIHWLIVPLVFITVFSIGLILVAQSLDRVFNPRVRARHGEEADLDVDEGEEQVSMVTGNM